MKKDLTVFIKHILESIDLIERYTNDLSHERFLKDTEAQDAVAKRLEIIGEAVRYLPEETKKSANKVQWQKIIAMRNILIHQYFGIDLNLVWRVVKKNLPQFKKEMLLLLKELNSKI